ncbi:MAG: AAA family ATPase [Lachnospiraceae bacterium]|nr:AAA family ATPase [Lachnospiraceae bacterium]
MSDFEHEMNKMFGGNRANYSVDDIEAAKKRQKKYGGTLYDNLSAITQEKTGQKPLGPIVDSGMSMLSGASKNAQAAMADINRIESTVKSNADEINKTLSELNKNIKSDFEFSSGVSSSAGSSARTAKSVRPGLTEEANLLEKYNGLGDKLKEKVFGQDDYLKKLVIAFKRPLVSERDSNDALNSIYITGPSCSGRHYSLSLITQELADRNVLTDGGIYRMDLSIYPTPAEEKLFVQDLYSALKSKEPVILFENFASCNVAFLTRLADLAATGESRLNERYIMQNGQLVGVTNALAGETVGSLEAPGKYLVFLGDEPVSKLADIMGAPFVNSLGDICATSVLSEDAIASISKELNEGLKARVKKQLGCDLDIDESFDKYALTCTGRGRALKGVIDAYDEALTALAEYMLESDEAVSSPVGIAYDEEGAKIVAGDKRLALNDYLPGGYSGELDAVEKELDGIVGLTKIKDYIHSLKEYYEVQKRRREEGLKAGELNRHMIFTGNPGTGKTTIARIVSRYLKAIGILSGGQLVEVSRGDLVGRYVGHTAPLVNQVVKSAIGGVLFIDEAYSLYRGEEDSFGLEAIDTLVKAIEDNRDNLIVILAGYSKEMEDFLEANSGLKSRFPNIIDFPDYTGEELLAIAHITARSKGYTIDKDAEQPLLDFFNATQLTNAREAGNGRLVRNKIEEAILNQSRRLVAEPGADMSMLMPGDFELNLL